LGDTIYECQEIDIPADFDYFIPNSQLSELRRSLVEKLTASQGDGSFVRSADLTKEPSPCEAYPYPYLYNISNRLSADFYGAEKTAYELKGGEGPIMQCRHCIRYSLGYCVKHGGKRPQWREPLSLVLGDGRRFRLAFDCNHCQMNVYGCET
jgi:putative protease